MKYVLASIFHLFFVNDANAQFLYSGAQLQEFCEEKSEPVFQAHCYGYIVGMLDFALIAESDTFCIPPSITALQTTSKIIDSLENDTVNHDNAAIFSVGKALTTLFPCYTN